MVILRVCVSIWFDFFYHWNNNITTKAISGKDEALRPLHAVKEQMNEVKLTHCRYSHHGDMNMQSSRVLKS